MEFYEEQLQQHDKVDALMTWLEQILLFLNFIANLKSMLKLEELMENAEACLEELPARSLRWKIVIHKQTQLQAK